MADGHLTFTDDRRDDPLGDAERAAILANPALGILNSKVVKAHGGTTGADDAAEKYLNTESAGSKERPNCTA